MPPDEKKLFARQAKIYAGYTAYTDHEIGRVIQTVEDRGKLDNTLIIYICGDNGTSPEGTLLGTPNQYTSYNGFLKVPVEKQLKFYDAWGSAPTYPHVAVAWSWAFDTPFKWTKQVASHFGGTRQGLAISWPARIKDAVISAANSTTSSISFRQFSRPPASGRRNLSTVSNKTRSKA